ncbi:ATP-binding protein [Gordonia sp. NPDC003585]|uniref:ATP-binding protein n=1 Tax=Gordonia sp. NPDC003585 TaxID=3154275 RepID=UPI0033B2BDEB
MPNSGETEKQETMATFRTSARAVDMLGRQQIAGIPTAISEIFKNAHDAYASNVRADYFPARQTLVIRDNGVGMTRSEFVERWLTVGTDSKLKDSSLPPMIRTKGAGIRRQMGEKGIGRLAIATLGNQLIVVTRAGGQARSGVDEGITVAFVQWSTFSIPGLTLDEVPVPIRTVSTLDEVNPHLVRSLATEFREELAQSSRAVSSGHYSGILAEVDQLSLDPRVYITLGDREFLSAGGTSYLIAPVGLDLAESVTVPGHSLTSEVTEFQKFLLGFSNTMTERWSNERIETSFFIHENSSITDAIDPESEFWTRDDFGRSDHVVEGNFDRYGTFDGQISVYGKTPTSYVEPWTKGAGSTTACGPFSIKFGYLQGKSSESRLAPDDYSLMSHRLDAIGGIYIYRDGIRVLPYGNSDYDYLDIEKRRSKRASTYFFSYRRMFGVIELDSSVNRNLQEKAGREGFRQNRAYREFVEILQNFFIQLAAEYFSADSDLGRQWLDTRSAHNRRAALEILRERDAKSRRKFVRNLQDCADRLNRGELQREADSEFARFKRSLSESVSRLTSVELVDSLAVTLERLSEKYDLARPVDLPLAEDEEELWTEYREILRSNESYLGRLQDEAVECLTRLPGPAKYSAEDLVDRRFAELSEQIHVRLQRRSEMTHRTLENALSKLHEFTQQGHLAMDALIEQKHLSRAQFNDTAQAVNRDFLLLDQALAEIEDDAGRWMRRASGDELSEPGRRVLKEEIMDLEERLEQNLELLQLGQTVEILSHELQASTTAVRKGLRNLKPWANGTPSLQPIVRDLTAAFTHLDGHLRLFTPLQRRLYRERVAITGREVEAYVKAIFDERLKNHEIELVVTEDFRNWTFVGFPSVLYPVFVNLMDNSIHWLTRSDLERKSIRLHYDQKREWVTIEDSGPGVRPNDYDRIFMRGFGRRRGGRGLGLYLARQVLRAEGLDLWLHRSGPNPVFVISKHDGDANG